MLKVIIAGSRNFSDFTVLKKECCKIFKSLSDEGCLSGNVKADCANIEIISGSARGADKLGEDFAKEYGIQVKRFPAQWDKYGKSAGYIRNDAMARYATDGNGLGVLIAFWDGKSRGTKHMIDIAKKNNMKIFVVDIDDAKNCVL